MACNIYENRREKNGVEMPLLAYLGGALKNERKSLAPPRLELGTFCVLDRRDNHYTTEPTRLYRYPVINEQALTSIADDIPTLSLTPTNTSRPLIPWPGRRHEHTTRSLLPDQ